MDQIKDSQALYAPPGKNARMPWLRLHITNLCNFNCPGCHVFKISNNRISATNMPYEVAERAITLFSKLMRSYLPHSIEFHLSIYGGEPLLNRPVLFQLLQKYGQKLDDLGIRWIVNTNGSLLNDEDLKNFRLGDVDIHMSIDGQREKHNKTRRDKLGRPTYHRVMAAVDLIKQRQYRWLQFDCVANPFELATVREPLEVAKERGVNRIHFDLFYSPQYPLNFLLDDYAREYAGIYLEAARSGISVFASPFSQIYADWINDRVSQRVLTSVFPVLEVFADGSFIFSELPLIKPFDKLDNFSSDAVWQKRVNALMELQTEVEQKCTGCFLLPHCHGEMRRIYRYHTLTKENEEVICEISQRVATILKNNHFIPLGYG
jgi:sulfatase maturation enzyme AslB (radical SAM superfamily)